MQRYHATQQDSFFGDFVLERAVPRDHFLVQLRELIDWRPFTRELSRLYRGRAEQGRPPYEPAVLLKMLFVSYLYDLSDRQTEEAVRDSLSLRHFLGLAVDAPVPDATTLVVFRTRLLRRAGERGLEAIFAEVLRQARARGVRLGRIQVVDSVHTSADVNVEQDGGRRKNGRPPRDPDARWGTKGNRRERDEQGQVVQHRQHFYGYKAHVSLNAGSGLITSVQVTAGQAYDGHQLPALVEQDLAQAVAVGLVVGDRGYDDGENHELLRQRGIRDALHLNRYRTSKKDRHKGPWLRLQERATYQRGLRQRYRVEQKFGEMKERHGFRRCRYLGLLKYALQASFTALAVNLKRLVKLVRGVAFRYRPPPRPYQRQGVVA